MHTQILAYTLTQSHIMHNHIYTFALIQSHTHTLTHPLTDRFICTFSLTYLSSHTFPYTHIYIFI